MATETSPEAAPTAATPSEARTTWLQEIIDDYQAGVAHVFLLHGNVYDYADTSRQLTVRQYLTAMLGTRMSVVRYSPDEGIMFPGPKELSERDRKRFKTVTGLNQQGPDPTQQLLASAGLAAPPTSEDDFPRAPVQALPLIMTFLRDVKLDDEVGLRACALIDRGDLIFPPGDKATLSDGKLALLSLMHRAGTHPAIERSESLVLILTPTLEDIHQDLRVASSGIRAINVPLPDYEARLEYVESVIAGMRRQEKEIEWVDITPQELAATTASLGRRHIEDIILRATANFDADGDGVAGRMTRALVKARKAELMSLEYADVLEVLETPVRMENVGGHEQVKRFLADRIVRPFRDRSLADLLPNGIAFLGPAGTGKTYLASALANEIGFSCVLLRAEKIKGGIVGESERRLAKALAGIEALAPCVVFVDEIDQRFRRVTGGGGGGAESVESNTFGRLLEFFGDPTHRGRILGVAASNRPDQVDAALFRPGRFDVKIPLLPPVDAAERIAVLTTQAARYGIPSDDATPAALTQVAEQTEDWTQAELEQLVVMARATMRLEGLDFAAALRDSRARLRASTRDVQWMTRLALEECNDYRLVPERYRAYMDAPSQAPEQSARGDDERQPRSSRDRRSRLFD